MQPNRTQTHIDKPLTDMAIGFLQNPSDFIAGRVFPTKTVSKQSDKYFVYSAADMARDDMKLRAAGTESEGTGYTLSNDTYFCEKYAGHVDIPYDDLNNADEPINLERDAVELLTHAAMIRHEKLFAAACWATGIWSTDVVGSGTTQWSDYLGSSPIQVIDQAKRAVHVKTFKTPNTLILGEDVFLALKEHPDLVSRIQYTSSDSIDETLIARRFGVERVMVAKAILNSANEGLTPSMGFLLDPKSALLCYAPPSVGVRTASAAVNFAWTGGRGLPRPMGVAARRFDDEKTQSLRVEMEICKDVKVTSPDLGVFFAGIVA